MLAMKTLRSSLIVLFVLAVPTAARRSAAMRSMSRIG